MRKIREIKSARNSNFLIRKNESSQDLGAQWNTIEKQNLFANLSSDLSHLGLSFGIDIRGDVTWATQWEDAIAVKVYNRWLASSGGAGGTNCDSLRLVVHVFGEAPLDWEELTEEAVDLAKKEDRWPTACEEVDDVRGCREVSI